MSEPGHEQDMNSSELGHVPGHEPVQWVSIADAAKFLNISERAVHKRLSAGTLHRRKTSERVEVGVPVQSAGHEPTEPSSETGHVPGHEPVHSDKDALIEALQADVTFLRKQIEQRDVAESELRRLMLHDKAELQELRRKVSLLVAAPVEAAETVSGSPESEATGKHPSMMPEAVQGQPEPRPARKWWAWWPRRNGGVR